jgi:hypothetical protein
MLKMGPLNIAVYKNITMFFLSFFFGVGWDWVHFVRWPLIGLLYQPRMMTNVEQSVEWELAGETEVLGENVPQCHFVHQKSHMTWPGLEPGPPRWEAGV